MRKRLLAALLSLLMLIGAAGPTAFAAPHSAGNPAAHWFYDQLTEQGKAIYDAILGMYISGQMENGVTDYDLVENRVVDRSAVENYLKGNRTLFNDFAAAKDAFDLEHPEAWYVDSADLSLLVTSGADGMLHAYIGPGRTEDYYVDGLKGAQAAGGTVAGMSAGLKDAVMTIVGGAAAFTSAADKVRYVHDKITHSISYRNETDCTAANAGYIRTAYALVTHEGVCEGYARSFQYVMNELGIPCVLIHGIQTSGEPEAHMWCAVWLADAGAWYVVDPTWDDPVGLDAAGHIKTTDVKGVDGGETETYLLVGQDVVGAHWQSSGYVSTSTTAFTYPDIALQSYGAGTVERSGLKIVYAGSEMDGIDATVFHVSFNGDGLVNASKKGYYFLVRMYDLNADGSVNAFDDWYYSVHGLHVLGRSADRFDPDDDFREITNPYFFDSEAYLSYTISNCEYVEFAVTTKAPPVWETAMDLIAEGKDGYYRGDGSDIIAETGLIAVPNGGYEQRPYVKNASPLFNSSVDVGRTYTIHMEFTDPLYHPDQSSIDSAAEGKVNDAAAAMGQAVALDYTGTAYSWGVNARQPHTFAEKPEPQNARWVCETHGGHTGMAGINAQCSLTTLEYEFSASRWWADDSVQYEFYLTGLVGRKSNKFLANWSYVFENPSAYCSYRCSQGIDWNLWGQPQLLDNPNDLDFAELTVKGVDGKEESLAQLRERMQLDDFDMNGRLVLVVENLDSSRAATEAITEAVREEYGTDISGDSVIGTSLYEIDFARICSKTIVKTGDSLRLQIGFPPGFDSSMAGTVFKVYHFTRDAAGNIDGVEEIPVTVTKYGLVIVVKSFSPFAVVALRGNGIQTSTDRYVVLTSGGSGKVTADVEDQDMPGKVTFTSGSSHTFRIEPAEGYTLGTITFDGSNQAIEVRDNTFTLTYDDLDGGNLLNVTFIPASIEKEGETLRAPAVCGHKTTTGIPYQAPTCEEAGHTAGETCFDCGQVLTVSEPLAATGHVYDAEGRCRRCQAVSGRIDSPGGSGPSAPGGNTGAAAKNPDGSATFTAVDPATGMITETTAYPDGMIIVIETALSGVQVITVHVPEAPVTVSVIIPDGMDAATVTIAAAVMPGTVAVDTATGKIIQHSIPTADGLRVKLDCSAQFTLEDRSKTFSDIDGHWAKDSIAFVTAHGLFGGTGGSLFEPDLLMTRAMLMTVLARLDGAETEGGSIWYEKGMAWAVANGISDGSDPESPITREELAVMLWRYAGKPAFTGDLSSYPDAGSIDDWAGAAMGWAVRNGIITGSDDGRLNPRSNARRSEVSAMLTRFCKNIEN